MQQNSSSSCKYLSWYSVFLNNCYKSQTIDKPGTTLCCKYIDSISCILNHGRLSLYLVCRFCMYATTFKYIDHLYPIYRWYRSATIARTVDSWPPPNSTTPSTTRRSQTGSVSAVSRVPISTRLSTEGGASLTTKRRSPRSPGTDWTTDTWS